MKGIERETIELQQKNNCAIHVVANGFGEQLLGPTSRDAKLFMNKVLTWCLRSAYAVLTLHQDHYTTQVAQKFRDSLGESAQFDATGNYHLNLLAQALRIHGFSMVLVTRNPGDEHND